MNAKEAAALSDKNPFTRVDVDERILNQAKQKGIRSIILFDIVVSQDLHTSLFNDGYTLSNFVTPDNRQHLKISW